MRALCLALLAAGCGSTALPPGAPPDAAAPAPDLAPAVGPRGGAVDHLFFAVHGDTRPRSCDDTAGYPTEIIRNIFTREAAMNVEFAVDLGDHMYVCNDSLDEATAQMKLYLDAAALLPAITFMTMGNHECNGGGFCPGRAGDANSTAFRAALAPVSPEVYYSVDVATRGGLATFVFVADNAWDIPQQDWLRATLERADASAKYTIVARHHPIDDGGLDNPAIWQIIRAHKYTLFLTGHSHLYSHDDRLDPSGRTLRMGIAGAPLADRNSFYGFATVEQQPDDQLAVTVYDQATGDAWDTWSVPPQ